MTKLYAALLLLLSFACAPALDQTEISSTETQSAHTTPTESLIYGQPYELQGTCSRTQCLFVSPYEQDYPVGTSTLQGYYLQEQEESFGASKLCDNFVILTGSSMLIEAYLSLIAQGNSVNTKNDQEQVIISLDLRAISESEKTIITLSTLTHVVDLLVLSKPPEGRGVEACFSPVEILKATEP